MLLALAKLGKPCSGDAGLVKEWGARKLFPIQIPKGADPEARSRQPWLSVRLALEGGFTEGSGPRVGPWLASSPQSLAVACGYHSALVPAFGRVLPSTCPFKEEC